VSGQSPIVDVQNVTQSRVMTREVLDSIPSGKQFTALASLVLARSQFRGLFLAAASFYAAFLLIVLRFVPASDGPQPAAPPPEQSAAPRSAWVQADLIGWFAAFVLMFSAISISISNMSLSA